MATVSVFIFQKSADTVNQAGLPSSQPDICFIGIPPVVLKVWSYNTSNHNAWNLLDMQINPVRAQP